MCRKIELEQELNPGGSHQCLLGLSLQKFSCPSISVQEFSAPGAEEQPRLEFPASPSPGEHKSPPGITHGRFPAAPEPRGSENREQQPGIGIALQPDWGHWEQWGALGAGVGVRRGGLCLLCTPGTPGIPYPTGSAF